jgi:cobalt-zinc-cadmium efflux system outer membrane protein
VALISVGYAWTVRQARRVGRWAPGRGALALGLTALAAGRAWGRPITFAEARAAAEAGAPDVALARGRGEVARAQVGVAGALANPAVTVTTARETAKLGTAVSVPLPLFGQRGTAVGAARADAEAARLDVAAARYEARWAATIAWLDLWEAQERARLLVEAARDAERVATIADEKFAAGTAPRVDVLRTAADRARARADAAFAAAGVPAAAARLATAIGAGDDVALAAEGAPGLGHGDTGIPALEQALAAHPALARDRAQIEAAAAHVRAEQRLRWPVVNAELAVNFRDPTLPGTDVIGGLSLEAPVLNLRRGAIARAQAEQALAETTAELERRRLHAELVDAARRAEGAGARARSLAADVLPALEAVRRMTEEGYRDGRVDLLRLLDAQRARLESRVAEVEAEAAWERALADIERAAGVRLDEGAAGGR